MIPIYTSYGVHIGNVTDDNVFVLNSGRAVGSIKEDSLYRLEDGEYLGEIRNNMVLRERINPGKVSYIGMVNRTFVPRIKRVNRAKQIVPVGWVSIFG